MPHRVLLLMPTTTYKAEDFLDAARRLDIDVTVGTDRRQALDDQAPGHALVLDFADPESGLERIVAEHRRAPFRAVLGVDDETTVIASMAGAALGLPHNPEDATRATRDKYAARVRMAVAGMRVPQFHRFRIEDFPGEGIGQVGFPCVLKPLCLSASRGVLRADDADELAAAVRIVAQILREPSIAAKGGDVEHLLVEDYLPGDEVALEAVLTRGRLRTLALFDKPDPLHGPTFEETIYVTPSRLSQSTQAAIAEEVAEGCDALGLREGPVHAELRLDGGQPCVLEIAARTIGGLCSRTLRFGSGMSLEELVLRHALGLDTSASARDQLAAGVMMIPIPAAGLLRGVEGLEQARGLPLIEELVLSARLGSELVPLPRGDRYLGFIFARGETAEAVERELRAAHGCLRFDIA